MDRKINVIGYLLLVLFHMVPGLGSVGIEKGSNVDRAERLKVRAAGFLEARAKMNLEEMGKFYLEPRQAQLGNIVHKGGKIESIVIEDGGSKALVRLKVSMQAMGFTFKDVPRTQHWMWEKGDWYIDPAGSVSQTGPFSSKKDSRVGDDKSKK